MLKRPSREEYDREWRNNMSSKSSSPVKLQKSASESEPPKKVKAKSEALTRRKPVPPVQESSEPDTAKQKERYEKPWLENMAHPAEDKPPKYRKEYQPPPKPEPKPKKIKPPKVKEDMKTPKRYITNLVEQVDKVP